MSTPTAAALRTQCKEQWERCLYTSASLLIWLRALRYMRIGFITLPIVCGALASWDLLSASGQFRIITAVLALMAGVIPAVYAALKLDEHIPTAARLAGEYKNLEMLFKDLGALGPHKALDQFESEYKEARSRLEKANAESYTAPEWCFGRARKKIKEGHYTFGEDPPIESDQSPGPP
jgi:hypothetical protein